MKGSAKYFLATILLAVSMLVGQSPGPGSSSISSSNDVYSTSAEPPTTYAYASSAIYYDTDSTVKTSYYSSAYSKVGYGGAAPYGPASSYATIYSINTIANFLVRAAAAPSGSGADVGTLIAGGRDAQGNCLAGTLLFDEATSRWISASPMPDPEEGAGVAIADDNRAWVVGGDDCHGHVKNTVQAFDPSTNTWSRLAAVLPTPRTELALVAGESGKLYAIGGRDQNGNALSTVEIYDPAVGYWIEGNPMSFPRSDLGAALVSTDGIYALAGKDSGGNPSDVIEKYDETSQAWSDVGKLETARIDAGVTMDEDGRIVVVGGQAASGYLDSIEVYDPATNLTVTSPTKLSTPVAGPSVSIGPDGDILVAGGINSTGPISNVEKLILPPLPSHSSIFYLHGSNEPLIAGGMTMDKTVPLQNQPVSLLLGSTASWLTSPALSGTVGRGGVLEVVMPCSVGLSVDTQYALFATDLDGGSEQQLGSTSNLLNVCLFNPNSVVTIQVQEPLTLNKQRLKLTISNGLGLNLNFSGAAPYFELTNFAGQPS